LIPNLYLLLSLSFCFLSQKCGKQPSFSHLQHAAHQRLHFVAVAVRQRRVRAPDDLQNNAADAANPSNFLVLTKILPLVLELLLCLS
jgi:hypothetical protein